MESDDIKHLVESGQLSVGIELGSTRIKTIAIAPNCETIATGSFEWENKYENGYWTYSINDVWVGIQKVMLKCHNQLRITIMFKLNP